MSLNQTASNATLIYAKIPQRKIMILRLLFLYRLFNITLVKKVFYDTLNYDIEPLVVYH